MKLGSAVAGVLFVALNLCFVQQLCAAQAGGTGESSKIQTAQASSAAGAAKPTSADGHKPATYVGSAMCKACHSGLVKEFSKTMMGKIFIAHPRDEVERKSCEGCHGPGSLYVKDMTAAMGKGRKPDEVGTEPAGGGLITFRKGAEPDETQNQVCLNCHEQGERAFWRASTHAFRSVRCVDCHTIMRAVTATEQPNPQNRKSPLSTEFVNPFVMTRPETQVCLRCHLQKKMEINLPSHMPLREGSMVCTDCHNPHGGPYPHQLRAATVNEVCYRCHAEKRGPFLWMHAPVAMNCLNCHKPHGSINPHLLVINLPLLCQRCHIGTHHPSSPHAAGQIYVINQQCANCHSQIHGSNSPGGRYFTR